MSDDAKKEELDEATEAEENVTTEAEEPSELEKLQAEVLELKDRLLRTMAEMENVRRRAERDRSDASAYAVTGFARDMLSVSDNLHRTLHGVPETVVDDMKPFVDGVEMTERELLSNFEKHGINRVEPKVGEKFDHNKHQAMFEVPSEEINPGNIAQVVSNGYVIKDRLLRPAMVGVAISAAPTPEKIDTEA